jgi:DNA-binding HxlR family transcriptional regulator
MVQDDPSMRKESESQDGKRIPVASMVESIVGCKWSIRILQLCAEGHNRPGMVLRACPGLSAKVMNERWRKMIRFGIMRRTVYGIKPPVEVEYQLTPFGRRFLKILDEVRKLQVAVENGAISESNQRMKKGK